MSNLLSQTIFLIDIGFITVVTFMTGYFLSVYLDKFFDIIFTVIDKKHLSSPDKEGVYSIPIIMLELCVQLFVIGIIAYFGRTVAQIIPFPFDGYNGYKHMLISEMKGGTIMFIVLFLMQTNVLNKINYLRMNL